MATEWEDAVGDSLSMLHGRIMRASRSMGLAADRFSAFS
jgi:hypothetical protein